MTTLTTEPRQPDPNAVGSRRMALGRGSPLLPALGGVGAIMAFCLSLGIWGAYAPVSGAAIAEGSLKVEGNRQAVQHPYGGVVQQLLVREGDKVARGQILLRLSDIEPRSQVDILTGQQDAYRAEEARLVAERDGAKEPAFGADLLGAERPSAVQAMANERAVMSARLRQHETETGVLRQRIAQLRENRRGLEAQAEGLRRQAELIEEELKGARELLKSGFTPKTRVLALERNAAGLLADRGAKLSEIASTDEATGGAELEIAKRDRERTAEITGALRTVQTKLAEIGPKLGSARDILNRTEVAAPATGAVVGLSIFTEGGVIAPGAKLLDIVPSDDTLAVQGRLQLSDLREVSVGREADVRLTSVHRSDRPQLRGLVTNVSADRLTDEKSGQGYYLIQVQLNADDVRRASVDLQAGMPAQIVVTTRPRTLIQYLVAPLADEISGAFRER